MLSVLRGFLRQGFDIVRLKAQPFLWVFGMQRCLNMACTIVGTCSGRAELQLGPRLFTCMDLLREVLQRPDLGPAGINKLIGDIGHLSLLHMKGSDGKPFAVALHCP